MVLIVSEYSKWLPPVVFWQLECTKFVFGRGFARTPLKELTSSPDRLAGLRGPTSEGGEERERRRWEEGNGRDRPSFSTFIDPPLHNIGDIGYFEYDTVDVERRLYQSLEKYAEASKLDFSVCHNDVDERANHGQTFKNHTNLYID